ncbi:MAG: rhamnulokinase family protein [Anaerolineales bacterium]
MKSSPAFLAFDLGAESGRVVLGRLQDDRIELQDIHRFPNGPVRLGDSLHWDVLRLWEEMKHGLALAARRAGDSLVSLGVDAWGVDFGLLDRDDNLLGNPFHYRDRRTEGILGPVSEVVSPAEIYRQTGIQLMPINSLYQLFSMARARSPQLVAAQTFLNIPDLFNFWFSGVKVSEYTIATTTQCYNPVTGKWAWDLLKKLEIPPAIFGEIVPPGTMLGKIRPAVADEAGLEKLNVVAVASHDTQAAIAAVPAGADNFVYLSSGTWSLIGIEVDHPIITAKSQKYDLTNEGGYGGKFCLLKNILGLWLLQECRREWAGKGQSYSYDDLTQLAGSAAPLQAFVNPTDPGFLAPGDMPVRIQAFCRATGQPVPQTQAEIVRCILESLALEYRYQVDLISSLAGYALPVIHIIGGGARNALLDQFTANATGRPVIAGPVEASALGNILVQAISAGHVASIAEGRSLVGRSVETRAFDPVDAPLWEQAYERYGKLRSA